MIACICSRLLKLKAGIAYLPSIAFLNLYWGGDMQIVENVITAAEEKMPEKYKKILREMGLLEE